MNCKICWVTSLVYIIGVVLAGCKKNSGDDRTIIPIYDERLANAVIIRPGSYFIYRDSASGTLDSFDVTDYEHGYSQASDGTYLEYCRTIAVDSDGIGFYLKANTMYIEGMMYTATSTMYDTSTYRIRFLRLPWLVNGFGWMDSRELYTNIDSARFQYINHFDTLRVAGKAYGDVYETESITYYDVTGRFAKLRFHSYFSMNDGLIRFEKGSMAGKPQVFNLIQSKIIRNK